MKKTLVLLLSVLVLASCTRNELGKSARTAKKLQTDLYCMTVNGSVGFEAFIDAGGASSAEEVSAYLGDYLSAGPFGKMETKVSTGEFGCSTLKIGHNTGGFLVGRNYDWDDCTTLIIRNIPSNGYASLSTVNLDFLGFGDGYKPEGMVNAFKAVVGVYVPMDGINEKGLVVADLMAGDDEVTNQNTSKKDLTTNTILSNTLLYRPFDFRSVLYTGKTKGIQGYPRYEVMRHLINKSNYALIVSRQLSTFDCQHVLCTEVITDMCSISSQTKECSYVFPLYLYPSESELGFEAERKPNLDDTIWWTIENWVKYGQAYKPQTQTEQSGLLDFNNEQTDPHFLAPEDIFDYIYGVLHSPLYREKYKEFLKVDFPRIPYPKNADEFEHFKECGRQLRELHLMHNVPKSKVTFDIIGNNKVESIRPIPNKDDGYSYSIYINDTQYFAPVPIVAWDMYIGGYQPAQKWLKDRKGRVLSTEEIEHYQKIIRVLLETKRIMDSIDSPEDKQLSQLQRENAELRHKLQQQQSGSLVNYGTVNIYEK